MSGSPLRADRSFVDTDVLIYAFDLGAGEKRTRALGLLRELWRTGGGCLSVQVLQEFHVAATRGLPNPLPAVTAGRIVAALTRWKVHAPDSEDVLAATELAESSRLSFWDAMVLHSAGALGCSVLYSDTLAPERTIAGMRIVDPFA